jgi:5-methylcytosine-specific restriction endonuclease McrA
MNEFYQRILEIVDKERRRAKNQRTRARRQGCAGNLSSAEWLIRLLEFNFACAYCGEPMETIDHIVPVANGGGTVFANVLPACAECNQKKRTAVWLPAVAGAYTGESHVKA